VTDGGETRLSKLRAGARDGALIFFGALGVFGVSFFLAAQISLVLAGLASRLELGMWSRVSLGMVALDLSKAPALVLGALVLALAVRLSPLALALTFTAMVYLLDLGLALLMHQAPWLWFEPLVLVLRLVSAGALTLLVFVTVRWRRRK